MPSHDLPLAVVVQSLESGLLLAEALLFPEYACAGSNAEKLVEQLAAHVERLMRRLPAEELYRRFLTETPMVDRVTLTLEPGVRSAAWQTPIELTFPVLRWSHPAAPTPGATAEPPPEAMLAYVPALAIEVVAKRAVDLDRMLESHIRAAILRQRANESLAAVVWLQRSSAVELVPRTCVIEVASPKQKALAEAEERERSESVLPEVGVDLSAPTLAPAYTVADVVQRLAESLTGRSPRCVLLVGPSGVGKTAIVHELVRRARKSAWAPRRSGRPAAPASSPA